jgi:hypothetical protein
MTGRPMWVIGGTVVRSTNPSRSRSRWMRFVTRSSNPRCSGLQTVARGLANNVACEPTIRANESGLEPTFRANEPTFRLLATFGDLGY